VVMPPRGTTGRWKAVAGWYRGGERTARL